MTLMLPARVSQPHPLGAIRPDWIPWTKKMRFLPSSGTLQDLSFARRGVLPKMPGGHALRSEAA